MATQLKERETRQISVYLNGPAYARFLEFYAGSSYKSESEALTHCPRAILFPQEYCNDTEVAIKDVIAEAVERQVREQVAELTSSPGSTQKTEWFTTREAFDKLEAELEDVGVSWDRFRRLSDADLNDRYGLVGDRSRRRHGSTTSKWLYFAD